MNNEGKTMVKQQVFGRPQLLIDKHAKTGELVYWDLMCPGCQYGTIGGIIGELLDELGVVNKTICVTGVGCNGFLVQGLKIDHVSAPHGRPPDVATAIKRTNPDLFIFTMQGDGDCIAIGAGALIAALGRGEKFTIIMCNNTNYGTTGGQLAPTTILGQVTPTTPRGRNSADEGYPTHTAELVATFKGAVYSARGSLHTPAHYQKTKGYVKTAFEKQLGNVGLSFVEIISACPPNWHMTPVESLNWIEKSVIAEFPLGEFKNVDRIE